MLVIQQIKMESNTEQSFKTLQTFSIVVLLVVVLLMAE